MKISLPPRARTTQAIHKEHQESKQGSRPLARQHGLGRATLQKCPRDTVQDVSHWPHRLQTTLTAAREAIVVYLRQSLLLSLDDLLTAAWEFLNPAVSRAGLDRYLCRNLNALQPAPEAKPMETKGCEPGLVHIDVKYPRTATVPLWRRRSRYPLGLRGAQKGADRLPGQGVLQSGNPGSAIPHPKMPHRQRLETHRPFPEPPPPPANTSSTRPELLPALSSNFARSGTRKPTAWSSAATAASPGFYIPINSTTAMTSPPLCSTIPTSTTITFPRRHCGIAPHPGCKTVANLTPTTASQIGLSPDWIGHASRKLMTAVLQLSRRSISCKSR